MRLFWRYFCETVFEILLFMENRTCISPFKIVGNIWMSLKVMYLKLHRKCHIEVIITIVSYESSFENDSYIIRNNLYLDTSLDAYPVLIIIRALFLIDWLQIVFVCRSKGLLVVVREFWTLCITLCNKLVVYAKHIERCVKLSITTNMFLQTKLNFSPFCVLTRF